MQRLAGGSVGAVHAFQSWIAPMTLVAGFERMVREDEPLAGHTLLGLGGPAQYLAEPNSIDALAALVHRCHEAEVPIRLLGGGSNLLVPEAGVSGVVVKLSAPPFCDIHVSGNLVAAGGGARLGHLISSTVREGLAGLEPLVGIPGNVGGALHGNAGSRGGDIGQWTCSATVLTRTGEVVDRARDDLVFAYRESSLDELAILSAQFQLEPDDPEELAKRMQKQWIVKKASQPLTHERTACVFKSPRGMSAGMLLEQAGAKGCRVGKAVVSGRNANYIVAEEGATASDVQQLIDVMRNRVADRLGVELELQLDVW